jgi:hypothetical protein
MHAQSTWRALAHGIVGGLIAGVTVALWFLVVDAVRTEPFDTPALLASTILGEEYSWPTGRLVAVYTVLHFGVFAFLGLAAGWLLHGTKLEPGLLVGAVFGVGVLNGAYYAARLGAGIDVLHVLPVGHVLGANLLGGMLMMVYLHKAFRATEPLGPAVLVGHPVLLEGLGTGLVGAGAVALWFLIVDVMTGIPFETPAALGSALFLGAAGPGEVQLNLALIGAYSVVHVAAFWAVGTLFAGVVGQLERVPSLWLMVLLGFIVVEGLFVGATLALSSWVLGALTWWAVGIGNVVAVAAMGWYLWQRHPALSEKIVAGVVETRI